MNTILELYQQRKEKYRRIKTLENEANELLAQIESSVANDFGINQAIMTNWYGCEKSPVKFHFVNKSEPFKCLYCDFKY